MSHTLLRERFAGLWRRMGAADEGSRVFDELLRAYQEPHRRYHGVDHLRDCLEQLDAAPTTGEDRDLAETALWFHDAVYVPGAADNEALSAEWAARALVEGGAPEARAHQADRLVRLTDHARAADDPLGALVCDVDLSILGRPPAEFAEYEKRIRAEYQRVPEPLYRTGRSSVLAGLLAREPLYRSEHFRALYEAAARRNLIRSLEHLRAGRATL
jgi:predicted metal-dependent HD superfamily phosphohydrolase